MSSQTILMQVKFFRFFKLFARTIQIREIQSNIEILVAITT